MGGVRQEGAPERRTLAATAHGGRWAGALLAPLSRRWQAAAWGYSGVGRGGPAGQAVERAADRRQMLPGDPERPCGGIQRLMPQQPLERPDIDPRFQQGRRTTMAPGMAAVAGRDARGPLRGLNRAT